MNWPSDPWHSWFAWKPVRTTDKRWVWLRRIRRRATYAPHWLPCAPFWFWEYQRNDGY